jgi:hypothetical protein
MKGDNVYQGSNWTAGYVPIIDADGNISGDSDITFSGDTLTATKVAGDGSALTNLPDKELDISLADHGYNGVIVRDIVAGENLALGDVAYQKASDSLWYKAKGDAYATVKNDLVLVPIAITSAATGVGILLGTFQDDSITYTAQNELWVSKATGGLITETQPTTPAFIRYVGKSETTHIIQFNGLVPTIVEI